MENCYCDKYKTRKYINSPTEFSIIKIEIEELLKENKFIQIANNCKTSDYTEFDYECKNCGNIYKLVYESHHNKGGYFGLKSKITRP